jgi:uncharacterized protein
METIFNNKRFIQASTTLVVLLSVFVAMLFINEIREGKYIGRGSTPLNSITVSGKGEVMAPADIATISINLTKDATTSKEAQNTLNESITKTLAYLKEKKIEDKDIKSEYGGVTPKYSYGGQVYCLRYPCPQPETKIVGYTATQSISVKVRDVDSANDVRTGLTTLGITDISGPTFSIDNEDSLREQARALAIKDAQEKAKVLARELGVSLGEISSFAENNGGYYPMYATSSGVSMKAQDAAPAPELPKGENKITSNVSISYEIR